MNWTQETVEIRHAVHAYMYWSHWKVSWELMAAMAQCVPHLNGRLLERIEKLCDWVRPVATYDHR